MQRIVKADYHGALLTGKARCSVSSMCHTRTQLSLKSLLIRLFVFYPTHVIQLSGTKQVPNIGRKERYRRTGNPKHFQAHLPYKLPFLYATQHNTYNTHPIQNPQPKHTPLYVFVRSFLIVVAVPKKNTIFTFIISSQVITL